MSSLDRSYIDEPFANHISKTRPYCLRTLEQRAPFQLQSRVRDLSGWLNRFDAENGRQVLYEDHRNVFEPPTDTEHEYMGSLKKQGRQPTFGFLVTLDGKEVFLHQKSVPRETWFLLQTGAFAKFSVEYDDQARPQAINVQPTAWTPSSEASVHGP
jgi:cold shock CspA family protein/ribosomal protein L34